MLLFEWLVRAAVLAALIGIGAWALEEVLRGANRSARFVWIGALLVSITLPSASLLLPDLWPELLKRPASAVDWSNANAFTAQLESVFQESVTREAVVTTPRWSGLELAMGAWIVASLLLGLRWVHGWYRLRRARVSWKEAILAGERVLVSEDLGPAVVGLLRPRVVVPSWLFLGSTDQQRMIVRHELQHLRAGDQWLLAFAPVLVALLPWNPALWWQLRRLRIAIELDCDARVLRGGESALEYGCMLLDVAGSTTALQPTLAALSEPRTSLERRIRAMTPTRYRHALSRAASLSALCTITLAGAIVAIAPTAQPVAAQQAVPVRAQQEGSPLVVVDGKVMSSGRLNFGDFPLATVEVLKPAEAVRKFGARARYGAVVITTRGSELAIKKADAELEAVKVRGTLEKLTKEGVFGRGTIEGEVIRSETGEPVVNAQVTIGNQGAITNHAGRFVVRAVPVGEHNVHVRTDDQAIAVNPVVVTANAVTRLEPVVVNVPSAHERARIEVEMAVKEASRAQAIEMKERSVKAEQITEAHAAEVKRSIRAALAAQAIEKAPAKAADPLIIVDGVKVAPKVAASAPARATTSQSSVNPIIVIDGVVVGKGADALKVLTSTLSVADIESVDVVKGEAARRLYGDGAVDGVISITLKKR